MRVESVHSIYPEAYWQAKERGLIAIPAGLLRDLPEPGHYIGCPRGLSPILDEAWDKAWRVGAGRISALSRSGEVARPVSLFGEAQPS